MGHYPVITPEKRYSVMNDDLFEPVLPAALKALHEKYDSRGWCKKYLNQFITPVLYPMSFQFQVTKLAKSLGLGPSLYLIQLKYFALLFFSLSFFGFLPFFAVGGGALTFGDFVTKYDSWMEITSANGILKCNGAEAAGMDQLLYNVQSVTYIETLTAKNVTLTDLTKVQKYFNAECANKTSCAIGLNNYGVPKVKRSEVKMR